MPNPEPEFLDDELDLGSEWLIGEELRETLATKSKELEERTKDVELLRERVVGADKANVEKARKLNEQTAEMRKLTQQLGRLQIEVEELEEHSVPIKRLQAVTDDATKKLNTLLYRLKAAEEHWHMLSSWLWVIRKEVDDKPCWCHEDTAESKQFKFNDGHTPLCKRLRYYFQCPPKPISEELANVTEMTFEEVTAGLFKGGPDDGDDAAADD